MNINQKDKFEIFENAISWIVVLAMFIYGGAKLVQFDGATEINKTVSELTGMELMWAFYGYSKSFALTIGLFEVLGGILIFVKKTRIIGCLFTSTILVNVILQDIYFGVHSGALKAAILYEMLILIILLLNRKQFIKGVSALMEYSKFKQSKTKRYLKLLIALALFIGIRILEYYITIKWRMPINKVYKKCLSLSQKPNFNKGILSRDFLNKVQNILVLTLHGLKIRYYLLLELICFIFRSVPQPEASYRKNK